MVSSWVIVLVVLAALQAHAQTKDYRIKRTYKIGIDHHIVMMINDGAGED